MGEVLPILLGTTVFDLMSPWSNQWMQTHNPKGAAAVTAI
jgi:hypothetical protein